jgi:hypothetical protein
MNEFHYGHILIFLLDELPMPTTTTAATTSARATATLPARTTTSGGSGSSSVISHQLGRFIKTITFDTYVMTIYLDKSKRLDFKKGKYL